MFLIKTCFRSDKNVADAKLKKTSLSTDVFMTVFIQKQPDFRRLGIAAGMIENGFKDLLLRMAVVVVSGQGKNG